MKKNKSELLDFSDKEYFKNLRKKQTHINHIHWDGSIPAQNLFDFYRKRGEKLLLPEKYLDGTPVKNREINSPLDLKNFQRGLLVKYHIDDVFKIPIGAMQTKEDLEEMAIYHCKYLKSQNIIYSEVRFAPSLHTKKGLSLDEVIGYSLDGFKKGYEETGVLVKPIVCINRGNSTSPEYAKEIVKSALKFQEEGVIGIDIVGYEPENPPEIYLEAIEMTFDSKLKRTFHVGEMCGEEENIKNIETVLSRFRPHGLSHAKDLWKREDLIEEVVRKKIRLESNPISNYNFFIKNLEDLHLDYLLHKGVLVTINPDDPMMWENGEMVHNLYQMGKLYGTKFVNKVLENAKLTAWGKGD